jgi:glucokinase
LSTRAAHGRAASFIAADVGGTHARIGLIRASAGSGPTVEKFARYVCADYPNLAAILRHFLDSLGGENVNEAAIACAGVCFDGTIINTNLAWTVSLDEIRAELNLKAVEFVNDFEAVAYATPHLMRATRPYCRAAANRPARQSLSSVPARARRRGTNSSGDTISSWRRKPGKQLCAGQRPRGRVAHPAPPFESRFDRTVCCPVPDSSTCIRPCANSMARRHRSILPAAITRAALDAGDAAARRTLDLSADCSAACSATSCCCMRPGRRVSGRRNPAAMKTFLLGSTFVERFSPRARCVLLERSAGAPDRTGATGRARCGELVSGATSSGLSTREVWVSEVFAAMCRKEQKVICVKS